ncbi:hypothetical protein J6590_003633 [Homalodisca vitripennis]|nr:hypothetical protein J6590_003633 [Homalodisca vitripennis]
MAMYRIKRKGGAFKYLYLAYSKFLGISEKNTTGVTGTKRVWYPEWAQLSTASPFNNSVASARSPYRLMFSRPSASRLSIPRWFS